MSELQDILTFIKSAESLKNMTRTVLTSQGRQESVAEHSWRLCLMAIVLKDKLPNINFERLLKICVIHDLGEAIRGDIPALVQTDDGVKTDLERSDLLSLTENLPQSVRLEIMELWEEYVAAQTPEAKIAKGLDKLETILQHNQGIDNGAIDYTFNLSYGRKETSRDSVLAQIREYIDADTQSRLACIAHAL